MTIAREEIFGPVLSILPYNDEEQAIDIANDTLYGLAAYVQSGDLEHARDVAARLRAGSVYVNYPDWDTELPSAATSSPATAVSTPTGASTTSSRSRASSATAGERRPSARVAVGEDVQWPLDGHENGFSSGASCR